MLLVEVLPLNKTQRTLSEDNKKPSIFIFFFFFFSFFPVGFYGEKNQRIFPNNNYRY